MKNKGEGGGKAGSLQAAVQSEVCTGESREGKKEAQIAVKF